MKLYFMNDDNETVTPDDSTNNIKQINTNIQDNEKNTSEQKNSNKQSGVLNVNTQINDSIQVNTDKNNNPLTQNIWIIMNTHAINCKLNYFYIIESYNEMINFF